MIDPAKSITVNFIFIRCGECSIEFYIPEYYYIELSNLGTSFTCPKGHGRIFTDSELTKEKKRRQWAEESRDNYQRWLKEAENKTRALKGVITKTKKRISNGICPCCNRSFQNLKRHMNTKHPTFYGDKNE